MTSRHSTRPARGGTGVYLLNTYNLPSRALYSLPALTLHESAPGHAFQMPLAEEQDGLPKFRRYTYISAFGEGWALYCELLGEEMGMYETPYEVFGMLSYQMWRASRLVVDTGIHAKGWTREQAQQFMHDNTALADHEITTEVDRYISWPGQALSYYLGEMAIVEARRKPKPPSARNSTCAISTTPCCSSAPSRCRCCPIASTSGSPTVDPTRTRRSSVRYSAAVACTGPRFADETSATMT